MTQQVQVQETKHKLEQFLTYQEIKLAQKSHQFWLVNEDHSTRYFHIVNKISSKVRLFVIKDKNGLWKFDQNDLKFLVFDHFQNQYEGQKKKKSVIDFTAIGVP